MPALAKFKVMAQRDAEGYFVVGGHEGDAVSHIDELVQSYSDGSTESLGAQPGHLGASRGSAQVLSQSISGSNEAESDFIHSKGDGSVATAHEPIARTVRRALHRAIDAAADAAVWMRSHYAARMLTRYALAPFLSGMFAALTARFRILISSRRA